MPPLVIIKTGDTFPELAALHGDFEDWIIAGLAGWAGSVQIIDPRRNDGLPPVSTIAGAIITGSHAMVTARAAWSEQLAAWLCTAVAAQRPLLGICYGHQLLAHALGGVVADHPQGLELGTVGVELTAAASDDPLFGRLPARFAAQVVHRQSVRQLPPGATCLAGNTFEPHQAFRVGPSAWGVQFHPEFSADAMAGYVRILATQGEPVADEQRLAGVTATPIAATLLERFTRLLG